MCAGAYMLGNVEKGGGLRGVSRPDRARVAGERTDSVRGGSVTAARPEEGGDAVSTGRG